jgi:hypothetical protein
MRLFIAREAVDTHLKLAGALIDPKVPLGEKIRTLVKSGAYYAYWYPKLWLGWGRAPMYSEFGPLASHLRFVNRASRKLARTLFHCMIRFGPKLEKRQAVLGRLVEIGAELLAISATCARAHQMVQQDPANRGPLELAALFSQHARRRVEERFGAVFDNDDVATYAAAQDVLRGDHAWVETGLVRAEEPAPRAAPAASA